MKLIFIHLNQSFLFAQYGVLFLGKVVIIFEVGHAFPIEQVFCHAGKQEHQGHYNHRDGTHGEQNQRQNGKASLTRPMRMSKRLVAKRLNALAHRFEYGHHGGECTPLLRNARKCMGGAL